MVLEYIDGEWTATYTSCSGVALTPPRPLRRGMIYFIGPGDGPVKIGFSTNLAGRLVELQACSPLRLTVLAQAHGTIEQERDYHKRFAAHRLHGEWFARVPEIEAEIAYLERTKVAA